MLRHGGGGGDVGGRLSGRKGSGKEKRRWVLGFWFIWERVAAWAGPLGRGGVA